MIVNSSTYFYNLSFYTFRDHYLASIHFSIWLYKLLKLQYILLYTYTYKFYTICICACMRLFWYWLEYFSKTTKTSSFWKFGFSFLAAYAVIYEIHFIYLTFLISNTMSIFLLLLPILCISLSYITTNYHNNK